MLFFIGLLLICNVGLCDLFVISRVLHANFVEIIFVIKVCNSLGNQHYRLLCMRPPMYAGTYRYVRVLVCVCVCVCVCVREREREREEGGGGGGREREDASDITEQPENIRCNRLDGYNEFRI